MLTRERDRLLRRVQHLEEQERLHNLSQVNSITQLLDGRQQLYDKLEECLEIGGEKSNQEIETVISSLRLRSGAYGVERRLLISNLFKSIIDLSFPSVVKYLFWACDEETGIFEHLSEAQYLKYKRMSKYKREEIAGDTGIELQMDCESEDQNSKNEADIKPNINLWLDIDCNQNQLIRDEIENVAQVKQNFSNIVQILLKAKQDIQ